MFYIPIAEQAGVHSSGLKPEFELLIEFEKYCRRRESSPQPLPVDLMCLKETTQKMV